MSAISTSEAQATLLAYGLTTQEISTLTRRCTEAKATAYCPYSKFQVGCTLLLKPDAAAKSLTPEYVNGANVENAAYPVGTCAERVALGTAVAAGHRFGDFKALAIATNTEPGSVASPCGMCRQFIREFCEPGMPVMLHDKEGNYVVQTLEQLLPMSFGPENLLKTTQ